MATITDADAVIELYDYKEVNKYLNDGWTLLAVHPNTQSSKESQHPNVYVLADAPLAADLKDTMRVAEVDSSGFETKLDEGYVLLQVVQNNDETLKDIHPAIYVMGKPLSSGAKYTDGLGAKDP